jgi:hypothetical protein
VKVPLEGPGRIAAFFTYIINRLFSCNPFFKPNKSVVLYYGFVGSMKKYTTFLASESLSIIAFTPTNYRKTFTVRTALFLVLFS